MKRASAAPTGVPESLSELARAQFDRWDERDRKAVLEALRGLPEDLHRELVQRSICAGRGAAEVLSFARALTALSRAEAIAACTFKEKTAAAELRLRAASDPLFAFEANGKPGPHRAPLAGLPISLRRHPGAPPPPEHVPTVLLDPEASAERAPKPPSTGRPIAKPRSRTLGDDAGGVKRPREAMHELGESEEASYSRSRSEPGFTQDLLNAALEPFGVVLQERAVDGPGWTLEQALDRAVEAVGRGIPVPVALGREVGELKRYALILQVQSSGRSRAFQLLDPVMQELVWAHESDLLRRVELPFESKAFRRITAVALPRPSK